MRGARPISSSAVRVRPKACTSSAPKVETPTSDTQTGRSVTARMASMRSGHSLSCQWFQSSGNPCTATASMRASAPCDCRLTMKAGSMGEMPPITRVVPRASASTASAANVTICANSLQPGSISASQCDMLFGSFQNITASTMASVPARTLGALPVTDVGAPAQKHFGLGVTDDAEARAAQHGLEARSIRHPPVGGVVGISLLHEVQPRIVRGVEDRHFVERVIRGHVHDAAATAQHRLHHQQVTDDVIVQQVECQ